jgi:hypothetical protein
MEVWLLRLLQCILQFAFPDITVDLGIERSSQELQAVLLPPQAKKDHLPGLFDMPWTLLSFIMDLMEYFPQ